MIVVMGGHIDHGKSTVAALLAGRPLDPLPDERRRGMTLDLHAIPVDLGGEERDGLIDVPGHERLVRSMAAGAAGTDVLLLVVAADDGIMPQTLEHLAVAEGLGIPAGVAIITKPDLVDDEWLALVQSEVARLCTGSPIRFLPPFPIERSSPDDVDRLRRSLASLRAPAPRPSTGRPFRMMVDRCVMPPGQGVVVTGTVSDGSLRLGEEVELLPAGVTCRVRSLHRFGESRDAVGAGERAGIGLAGASREQCERGAVVVAAGSPWRGSRILDAIVRLEATAPVPLRQGARVRVLAGTQEALAQASTRVPIEAGGEGATRLRLDRPLVLAAGDRLVLRRTSPAATIGAGEVLDPFPPPRSRRHGDLASSDRRVRMAALVGSRRDGVPIAALPLLQAHPLPVGELTGLISTAGRVWSADRVDEAIACAEAALPDQGSIPVASLRAAAARNPALAAHAVHALEEVGRLELREGRASRPGMQRVVVGSELVNFVGRVAGTGLTGQSPESGDRELAEAALAAGSVVRLPDGRLLALGTMEELRRILRGLPVDGGWSVADLREVTGLSRRLLVPLLEWCDRQGWTVRAGSTRLPGPRIA